MPAPTPDLASFQVFKVFRLLKKKIKWLQLRIRPNPAAPGAPAVLDLAPALVSHRVVATFVKALYDNYLCV